jgi:putative nucleotidyltransferase with HDIG domain
MATTVDVKIKHDVLLHVIVEQLQDLPPLPAVIIRVMQTVNDPKTAAQDLNRLISADPAIASKLLRLVNSSYYGFGRRVTTITDAVVILGFNAVRDLATSLGAFNAFRARPGGTALDRTQFWTHSVATAVAANTIARFKRVPVRSMEEVFIGGLLHDVGKLFLDQFFPQQYYVVLKLAGVAGCSVWDAEKKALGVGHAQVGKRVAEKWNLPPSLIAMIGYHHQPSGAGEYQLNAAIVHAADIVARQLNLGFAGDKLIPTLLPDAEKLLGIRPESWPQIQEEAMRKFKESQDLLKIATGGPE